MLARMQRWARTTRRGDLAEIRGLSDSHPVWPQVTSTRESCLGARCPEFSRCHVVHARREALEADIVIVNHHLLLADLALKEDGFGDLLGSADAIILDEAHQIPDLATQFFGARVSSRQVETLLHDFKAELASHTQASHPAQRVQAPAAALAEAEDALLRLRAVAGTAAGRLSWTPGHSTLGNAVHALEESLGDLRSTLAQAEEESPLAQLAARAAEVAASLGRIGAVDELEGARDTRDHRARFHPEPHAV